MALRNLVAEIENCLVYHFYFVDANLPIKKDDEEMLRFFKRYFNGFFNMDVQTIKNVLRTYKVASRYIDDIVVDGILSSYLEVQEKLKANTDNDERDKLQYAIKWHLSDFGDHSPKWGYIFSDIPSLDDLKAKKIEIETACATLLEQGKFIYLF